MPRFPCRRVVSVLHLHRSERADLLVEALAGLLASSAVDAFAPEVVAVPASGVERWLSQRLSHHLGGHCCIERSRERLAANLAAQRR